MMSISLLQYHGGVSKRAKTLPIAKPDTMAAELFDLGVRSFLFVATTLTTLHLSPIGALRAGEPDLSCGPRAVSIACRLLGVDVSRALPNAFAGELQGEHSYRDLERALKRLGMHTRRVHVRGQNPQLAPLPLIAAIRKADDENHFVVLYGDLGDVIQLLDFPHDPVFVSSGELAQRWDGHGIYVAADPDQLIAVPWALTPYVDVFLCAAALTVAAITIAFYRRFIVRRRETVSP
jgi:ABC-type bacteriocin/lantibiotic exporter with double-glycine peptidase domain